MLLYFKVNVVTHLLSRTHIHVRVTFAVWQIRSSPNVRR